MKKLFLRDQDLKNSLKNYSLEETVKWISSYEFVICESKLTSEFYSSIKNKEKLLKICDQISKLNI
jgi:hypothetical protein